MANILKRTSDHIFYGTKTKNNRPVIGGYVTIYNTTTAAFFGQTQTDTNGNWTITVSNPTPTPGVYEIRFYGSGLRAALPPDGDWETLTVTSEGLDALNVVLSSYTSSVTCENDGTVIAGQLGSTGTTQTHVNAYYGVTSLTATNTVPSVGQYTISGIVTSGLSAAINTSTNQDVYVTAFPAANNYGHVDISVYANPIGSGIISTTKRFTVSKSRKGNDGSSGIIGPSLVYTGTWDSGRSYVATSGLVEAVKASDNNYYYARANSLNQNPTSSPTYWTYFSNQFASVATDLLLAQDVAVGRGITLGTSTPDGGSTGVLKTANASSLYVGSGAYLAANAGGTGLFRVGLVAGGALTRGIVWDGDTSTFTIKAANFTLDSSGNITAEGGTVGGWTISSAALYKNTGTDATSAGMAPGDYPFYAGKQYASRATAPFRVTPAGAMTATSGSIGGWTIGTTSLTGGSNPGIGLAVGLNTDTSLGNPVIYAGDSDPSSAPFQVFEDGSVVASNADITGTITTTAGFIGGWAINTNYLGNGGLINMYSGANNTARIEVGTGATAGGMNSAAVGSDIIFWGGAAHGSRASAPFRVTASGLVTANNANISGTIIASAGAIGGWILSGSSLSAGNIQINSATGFLSGSYSAGTSGWKINDDGSAEFNNVTVRGTIYSPNGGQIGNWYINTLYLGNGANMHLYGGADGTARVEVGTGDAVAAIRSVTTGTDIAFYAGDSTPGDAPFRVTASGSLFATNATISGVVTAGSGSIGGWTINPTTLSKNNATLDSAGSLTLGTSTNVVVLSATDGTYRLWAGATAGAAAPFSVTAAGELYAVDGEIAGWGLTTAKLSKTDTWVDGVTHTLEVKLENNTTSHYAGIITRHFVQSAGTWYAGLVSGTQLPIYAGSSVEVPGIGDNPPFYVTTAGAIYASDGQIGGSTLTSTTITGGIIQTSSGTGQRVVLTGGSTNELNFYDGSNNNVVKIGTTIAYSAPGILLTNASAKVAHTYITDTVTVVVGGQVGAVDDYHNYGVYSVVNNDYGTDARAIYGSATGTAPWAGYFDSGNVLINNTLYFGSSEDTNLYRSAANTLKTDDSLVIAGGLTVDTSTLYVDSSSNEVGIGTTAPDAMLEIYTTSTGNPALLVHRSGHSRGGLRARNDQQFALMTTGSSDDILFGWENGVAGSFTEIARVINASAVFSVSGEIRATGDIISYYSDGRLKNNIQPLTKALDRLLAVRGVEFDWSKDTVSSRQFKHDVGVIAQEVMKVLPEAVTEPWSATRVGPKYHSVLYEKLIPLIIEAIRELKEEIDGKRTFR